MHEQEWKSISEAEFDSLLENGLSEMPPEDIVKHVTPFRKSINRVLIGLALSAITLNFFHLQYILPFIGVVLSVLGFRTLHKENKWFFSGYVISLFRTAFFLLTLIGNTTVYRSSESVLYILTLVSLFLPFSICICLWKGFLAVQTKAGLPAHAGSAVGIIIWYLVVWVLALVSYSGLIIGILMIAAYLFFIRNLFKLSKELDHAGYMIDSAKIHISDRALTVMITLLLAAGITLGYLFGGSYPMQWQHQEDSQSEEIEEIKAELTALGFPADLLSDLTDEDILACKGALRVVMAERDFAVNDGRTVTTRDENGFFTTTVYDEKELHLTGIAVELPGEREQWKIFHHFRFTDSATFFGTEAIQLWPTYKMNEGWWGNPNEVSGRLLYDKDGQRFISPYHSLGNETYTYSSIFFGNSTETDIFAEFSFPNDGTNRRGYLSYLTKENIDGYILDSWINYIHQKTWAQYPAMTAKEIRQGSAFLGQKDAFITIQDALQFYPNEEDPKPLG